MMWNKIFALLTAACLAVSLAACGGAPAASQPGSQSQTGSPIANDTGDEGEKPAQPAREYRAMWVSYLEWQQFDFSSAEAFRAGAEEMLSLIHI